jgi:outer membrane protein assembly factor BamD
VASGRDQTSTKQAMAGIKGFDVRFPDSEYKDKVAVLQRKGYDRLAAKELVIARFYARRDAWTAARRRAEGLAKIYPESKHAPEALYLAGKAWHEWGVDEKAQETREALAVRAPGSRMLAKLDRELATPPGLPPEEQTFVRPYRVSTAALPMQ